MCHPLLALSTALIYSTLTVELNILESASYVDRDTQRELESAHLWDPPTPLHLRSDFRPLLLCENDHIRRLVGRLSAIISKAHDLKQFEWTSISLTNLQALNKSYVLLGGSGRRIFQHHPDVSVTPREGGAMYLCEFESTTIKQNPIGFGPSEKQCFQISSQYADMGSHEFIGSKSSSININDELSLIAYCDPLWRATSNVPVGRCFLNMLQKGELTETWEFSDFCQSGQVATPCLAGHGLILSLAQGAASVSNSHRRLQNVQLWVGQPLSPPNGRVQIVNNPCGEASITTIPSPDYTGSAMIGSQFGFAVTDGFVTAPSVLSLNKNENGTFVPVIGVQTHKIGSHNAENFVTSDWLGSVSSKDAMFTPGTSIVRVSLGQLFDFGVVIGAPYHDSSSISNTEDTVTGQQRSANRGRLYLYCPKGRKRSLPLNAHEPQSYDDLLDGPRGSTYFGFSLSRLGNFNGDRFETIAVGAPDLNNERGFGQVYLIRILPKCRFDITALQTIPGPFGALDFGANLPTTAEDLDFNGLPDLVIPSTQHTSNQNLAMIQLYAARYILYAECRFTFPPWMAIKRIVTDDAIPVQVTVYLNGRGTSRGLHDSLEQIFTDEKSGKLVHQIIADRNANISHTQRFRLSGNIKSLVDPIQSALTIDFTLTAQQDVQDMVDIDSVGKGLYVAYRFLQPCVGPDNVSDEKGTCPNGGGLRRPLIDWSNCVTSIPLTRFNCYPNPVCQSSVTATIKTQSIRRSQMQKMRGSVKTRVLQSGANMTVDLLYGDTESSRPNLLIEVSNSGPTYAGGVWLELHFLGNLRFSHLSAYNGDQDLAYGIETNVRTVMTENETWAACYIGTIPVTPPIDANVKGRGRNTWYFNVSTYYPNYTQPYHVGFALGAGLRAVVITGTPDPNTTDNEVYINYRVVHEPKIWVSHGPRLVFSRMDNRTKPVPWLVDVQRRIDVEDIGPRVEHSFQVEYMGPTSRLINVSLFISVPSALSPMDYESNSDAYLVYFFREIRASVNEADVGLGGLQWVNVGPKIEFLDEQSTSSGQPLGHCAITDAEEKVNPKKLVGMDITKTYTRTRRRAVLDNPNVDMTIVDSIVWNASDQSTGDSDQDPSVLATTAFVSSEFRRIPKEILQCDRVGYRLRKPICTQIVCHVEKLHRHRPLLITVTGWLWARTLFDKRISDIDLVTTLTVDQGDIPHGVVPAEEPIDRFYLTQTFFFPQIRPKLLHQIPMWPIVVGVVLGVLFLTPLVILLYALGFFKRRKPALRKARYSRGGADELERNTTDAPATDSRFSGFGQTSSNRYTQERKKKRRGKRRADLTILHPADLAASQQTEQERERLLGDDVASNGKSTQINNNPCTDG